MDVIDDYAFSVTGLKVVFFCLLCFSVIRNVFEMRQLNRLFKEIQKTPIEKKTVYQVDKFLLNVSQDDFELVGKLKAVLIQPPRGRYNLSKGETPYKEHVLERAVRELNMLHRGYFVEVGAGDGETRSPTLCLETEDLWGGMLIEADSRFWNDLRSKRRKVTLGLACVGLSNRSYVGTFGLKEPLQSKLMMKWDNEFLEATNVDCYPLYTYLLAARATVVDFLVVNINGEELEVLKTLPWGKIKINIIAVGYGTTKERLDLDDLLKEQGYLLHRKYHQDGESFLFFVKQTILPLMTN